MKREIKFRIWDKNMNRWWCEDSQYLQMDGKKIHPAPWSTLSADLPDDSIVIEQYTGKKDKNGRDIYEGDILKIFWNDSYYYDQVRWYNDESMWTPHSPLTWMNKEGNTEVVGNIYENPELLEKCL